MRSSKMTKPIMSPDPDPVAAYLARAIEFSGRPQKEIAAEAGLARPNFLSMMKSGDAKIPIDRIPLLAKACGVDPAPFIRLALSNYHPEIFSVLVEHCGEPLSKEENKLIKLWRALHGEAGGDEESEEMRFGASA